MVRNFRIRQRSQRCLLLPVFLYLRPALDVTIRIDHIEIHSQICVCYNTNNPRQIFLNVLQYGVHRRHLTVLQIIGKLLDLRISR